MRQPADVRLLDIGFDAGPIIAEFANSHPASGGIASFIGQVRGDGQRHLGVLDVLDFRILHMVAERIWFQRMAGQRAAGPM